jgi:hypothetical protein
MWLDTLRKYLPTSKKLALRWRADRKDYSDQFEGSYESSTKREPISRQLVSFGRYLKRPLSSEFAKVGA